MPKNILTPAELFDHRLASLLGWMDPEAMKDAMPLRVYTNWQRYWESEPWGAWRDNMHAAVIAREIRRTIPGAKVPVLSVWMLRDPRERAAEANSQVLSALGTIGVKMSAGEASAILRNERLARSKSRGRVKQSRN